jgi:hypothetical protein
MTLTYHTTGGVTHRVIIITLGGDPAVLDVAAGRATLVERLDHPSEGRRAAEALAQDYRAQCAQAGRPLHGRRAPSAPLPTQHASRQYS